MDVKNSILASFVLLLTVGCNTTPDKASVKEEEEKMGLNISENRRFFITTSGEPFFWLGDTGWLLFGKTDRDEADTYLEDRKAKGFNVVQAMVLHDLSLVSAFGDSALIGRNVATPNVTEGNDYKDSVQYDYWDHVEYVIDKAAEKGIYMALVPVWGSNVKAGGVNAEQAKIYSTFLANRFATKPNIIWLNGGDIKGSDSTQVWQTIGTTLKALDTTHLVTFHPFGRTPSSQWFHKEAWLDFNMFQSGHRSYKQQENEPGAFSESNWKFVNVDYNLAPTKPTLDGEPSYEGIPHGLHDTTQPKWTAADIRRYGYWSVFAGGAGYTYGHNSVMQFHVPTDKESAYGSTTMWKDAINAPGAQQMIHLKKLMLSRSYLDRVPDSSLIADQGDRYQYLAATRGSDYAFIYTYNGRNIKVNMGKIKGEQVLASWYSPLDGKTTEIKNFPNTGVLEFDPPGLPGDGNDWVLILDSK